MDWFLQVLPVFGIWMVLRQINVWRHSQKDAKNGVDTHLPSFSPLGERRQT
jgi:hypothetical protein